MPPDDTGRRGAAARTLSKNGGVIPGSCVGAFDTTRRSHDKDLPTDDEERADMRARAADVASERVANLLLSLTESLFSNIFCWFSTPDPMFFL
ncbi:MAG: hypothetical protein ACRDYY_07670 [Acidimicrobiales bacterium]